MCKMTVYTRRERERFKKKKKEGKRKNNQRTRLLVNTASDIQRYTRKKINPQPDTVTIMVHKMKRRWCVVSNSSSVEDFFWSLVASIESRVDWAHSFKKNPFVGWTRLSPPGKNVSLKSQMQLLSVQICNYGQGMMWKKS